MVRIGCAIPLAGSQVEVSYPAFARPELLCGFEADSVESLLIERLPLLQISFTWETAWSVISSTHIRAQSSPQAHDA